MKFLSRIFLLGLLLWTAGCGEVADQNPTITKISDAPEKPETKGPLYVSVVSVSLQNPDQAREDFPASNLIDEDIQTWYVPGSQMESPILLLSEEGDPAPTVAGIEILGGAHNPIHPEYNDAFHAFSRLKKGQIFVYGATGGIEILLFELEDTDQRQFISFPEPIQATGVQLQILETHEVAGAPVAIAHFRPLSRWSDEPLPISEATKAPAMERMGPTGNRTIPINP